MNFQKQNVKKIKRFSIGIIFLAIFQSVPSKMHKTASIKSINY